MADMVTAIGPVVRMCEDEACRGLNDCPSAARDKARVTGRTIALTEAAKGWMGSEPYPEGMCALLAQEMVVGACASDSRGVRRIVPDGCEFRVHKGTLSGADVTDMGGEFYTALYSGPATCIDDILRDAPQWPSEEDYRAVVLDRYAAMRDSGALDALSRLKEKIAAGKAAHLAELVVAERKALSRHG